MAHTDSAQRTVTVVIVTVDGEITDLTLPADGFLEGLYYTIDCSCVDVVALTPHLDMWIDDEGLYNSIPNLLASIIAHGFGMIHQPYYGNAVFTGGADAEGDTVGITPELSEHLRELAGQ